MPTPQGRRETVAETIRANVCLSKGLERFGLARCAADKFDCAETLRIIQILQASASTGPLLRVISSRGGRRVEHQLLEFRPECPFHRVLRNRTVKPKCCPRETVCALPSGDRDVARMQHFASEGTVPRDAGDNESRGAKRCELAMMS